MSNRISCLTCINAMREPPAPGELPAIGTVRYICVLHPPTANAVPMQQGIVIVTAYPPVNEQTHPCRQWEGATHGHA